MALKISNLLVQRGSFKLSIPSLEIFPGEIISVVGPSGSGKSSLLLSIAGFVPIDTGQIELSGLSLHTLPPERRRVGYLFQKAALFPNLNVRDNVEFGLKVRGVARDERRMRALASLQRVQMAEFADRKTSELSGGQMQRVALARVLVVEFPVLLLDEPFASLDPPLRKDLRALVTRIIHEQQIIGVLVTHDPKDALALSQRVQVLNEGSVEFCGDITSGIQESAWLRKFLE